MAKDRISNTQVLLVALVVGLLLFVLMGCKITCKPRAETFRRLELGQGQGGRMKLDPVDFAIGGDFRHNPHYKARPGNKYQPLENGPIDFEYDRRKLESGEPGGAHLPELFEEFDQWYTGPPGAELHLANTVAVRNHLVRIGDVMAADGLQDEVRPAGATSDQRREIAILVCRDDLDLPFVDRQSASRD